MGFPGGAAAKRIVLEIVGWMLVVVGIAALVLPGPGLLMLAAGLVMLSQEYEWAERRVEPIKNKALRGAAEGVETTLRIALSTLFAARADRLRRAVDRRAADAGLVAAARVELAAGRSGDRRHPGAVRAGRDRPDHLQLPPLPGPQGARPRVATARAE